MTKTPLSKTASTALVLDTPEQKQQFSFYIKGLLKQLITQLNHGLVERDEAIKVTLLSVLAQENIVLVGPPGTGKSFLARKIADCFATQADDPNRYYEYLLTKFSTPEELFGPLSITELKADRFKRNTTGYLPSVQLAFLDEVFKASSSILNSLLTILNERIYHNGAQVQPVPLQALIAASNELPTENIELNALYDRFLIRHFVDYVSDSQLHRLFDLNATDSNLTDSKSNTPTNPLTPQLLDDIVRLSRSVILPPDVQKVIEAIWLEHKTLFKEDDREQLSDRRLRKVLGLLQVSAATNARTKIDLSDVFLLKHCLWNHPDNIQAVSKLILKHLQHATAGSKTVPAAKAKSITQSTAAQANQPVKKAHYAYGLQGSGTEDDPFIIATAADFHKLNDSNIGEYGFYFRQVADIQTNTTIKAFTGTYDGGGYMCLNNKSKMFETLNTATIKNLFSQNSGLAYTANNSLIINCKIICIDDTYTIRDLYNSTIQSCYINTKNRNGSICVAEYKYKDNKGVIENCFVQRNNNATLVMLYGDDIKCTNNITNISESNDPNHPNGQHVKFSADFFDRCKDQLKWDFEKVWEWDSASNQPILRKQIYQTEESEDGISTPIVKVIKTTIRIPHNTIPDIPTNMISGNFWGTVALLNELNSKKIDKILVKVGDTIIKDQPLIQVGNSKIIRSSHAGVVTKILVKVGDTVADNSEILEISNTITSTTKNTKQSKEAALDILTKQLKDNIWLSN